jgi:hypothetical protein
MVNMVCTICGNTYSVIPSRVPKTKYCSYTCHQIGEGRKGGAIRGEQVKKLSQGKTYTKIRGRHAHRVVMERILGRPLKAGEIVHHIDGNKINNDVLNLRLLDSQGNHVREHIEEMLIRRKEIHGY